MRMDVNPTTRSEGLLSLWALRSRRDVGNFATGSDKDIGGLSTCVLGVEDDAAESSSASSSSSKGRFYGTVSTDLPRNSRIERSGYAAFRNKSRPTLFGQQTWDTTIHPLLALRVRNRLAKPTGFGIKEKLSEAAPEEEKALAGSPALRQALHATSVGRSPIEARAIHALGIGLSEPMGPKFFINIQTDGPVTSDLFQHRLYFDERMGDAWQTVVIPFDDFVLTNTGQVAMSQLTMMRERIRTIGISVVLEGPTFPLGKREGGGSPAAPSALRKRAEQQNAPAEGESDWAADGGLQSATSEDGAASVQRGSARGSRRGHTFNFDLGIEEAFAAGSIEEIEAEGLL